MIPMLKLAVCAIAVDGAQALSKVATEKPDIMLMDMILPIIDGWKATRQIKANPETKDIQVIPLTAHAIVGDGTKCPP
jgi:CheY-like chemotaxis protein